MSRRFAEDTSVPSDRTATEIKTRLRAAGATSIAVFESPDKTAVVFQIGVAMYRITVPIDPGVKNVGQEERRAWRLLNLLMKAKLEAVREGATTIEREFLADRLLYDGRTLSEVVGPELQLAHDQGRMPTQLLLGAPK